MNAHDSAVLAGLLEDAGFELTETEDDADVVLFNTCSVRDHAEQRALSRVGALKKRRASGDLKVIGVMGCMAERMSDQLTAKGNPVDLVVGTGRLGQIPVLIERAMAGDTPLVATGEEGREAPSSARAVRPRPFQAYVAVMRGCNCRCAYCIVPSVRGHEVSRPAAEIVEDIRRLVAEGVLEVTLLGQNIDRYGKDLQGEPTLGALLRQADGIEGLARLRFVTSHPRDITDELLHAVADCPTACEYLHVPAQSGSSRILKAMGRGYTRDAYLDMIGRARSIVPGVEIASDFITGYPGETEADHEATLSLIAEARFQNGYFFKYSPRPGTRAAELNDDVPEDVKKRRHAEILAAQQVVSIEKHKALAGTEVELLIEGVSRMDAERVYGRTRSWRIGVLPKGHPAEAGSLVRARVVDSTALTLFCEPM